MPLALNTFQQHVFGIFLGGQGTPPLGMETGGVFRNIGECVGDLVEETLDGLRMQAFDSDPCPAVEWHGPVGVETSRGIYSYGQRIYVITQPMSVSEEIAQGCFYRGGGFPIPIDTQNGFTISPGIYRNPDMLDHTWSSNICKNCGAAWGEGDTRAYLPAFPKHRGRIPGIGDCLLLLRLSPRRGFLQK